MTPTEYLQGKAYVSRLERAVEAGHRNLSPADAAALEKSLGREIARVKSELIQFQEAQIFASWIGMQPTVFSASVKQAPDVHIAMNTPLSAVAGTLVHFCTRQLTLFGVPNRECFNVGRSSVC